MSNFTSEEKRHVLLFVLKHSMHRNSIENEEKWKELGREMNRDYNEIYNAYNEWKTIDNGEIVNPQENNDQTSVDVVTFNEDCNCMNEIDLNNVYSIYQDDIEKLYDIDNYEEYMINDTEVFNSAVYNDEGVVEIRNKRQLDLNDFDIELLKNFELQSNEELELKRKEHEKKMKIYKMQLDFAAEVHQEKMKILKAKLQVIQNQVYHIDHVICNKNLQRKFKSGPI